MDWKQMLDFSKGLVLTSPWYLSNPSNEQVAERICTSYATDESIQGYSFRVELDKLTKTKFLERREYSIALFAHSETGSSTRELGRDSSSNRELKDFYDFVRLGAVDADNQEAARQHIQQVLGGKI